MDSGYFTIVWAVTIIYMVASIAAGVISSRKQQEASAKGYFTATLPPAVIAFSVVAISISGVGFLGAGGAGYRSGYSVFAATTIMGGGWLGNLVSILILGKPMRRVAIKKGTVTLTDLLQELYKDNRLAFIAIPCLLIVSLFNATVQWVAIGNLFSIMLNFDYRPAVIIGLIVVALYSVLGGNRSTAIVGAVQCVIGMVVVMMLFIMAIYVSGGLTQMNTDLTAIDPGMVHLLGKANFWTFFSYSFIYSIGFCGQPGIITKFYQINSSKLIPMAMFIGAVSYICCCVTPFVGVAMRVKVGLGIIPEITNTDQVVPMFIQQYCNPFVGGLMVAACLSAIMSTGAAYLIVSSATAVNDICDKWLHIDCSGKKGVTYGRIAMIIILVLSGLLALFPNDNLLNLGYAAWGGFAAVFTPAIVLGLRWRRATNTGAFWSMLIGFLMEIILNVLRYSGIWVWPYSVSIELASFAVATLAMIIGSLASPPQEKEILPPTLAELRQRKLSAAG